VKLGFAFVALFIGQGVCAQDAKPWDVSRLCGRLEHVETIPERKHPDSFSERRKALREISLDLYERRANENCCDNLKPIDTIITDKRGHFEFKNQKPGLYWLVAHWRGQQYKVDVVYKPEKVPEELCSQQGMRVDYAGDAGWWLTVTVD
jgi:hypothetical protein